MVRFILHVIFLIILTVLILFNISYRTSVSIFGSELQDVPVVVILLVAFITGAVYALLSFFSYSVGHRRRVKQKGRTVENRRRERALNDREKGMDSINPIRKARKGESSGPAEPGDIPPVVP